MKTSSLSPEHQQEIRQKSAKPLLYVAMVSMSMIFAAFTSAYIVRMAEGNFWVIELPKQFYWSTASIVLGSISVYWALHSARKDKPGLVKLGMLGTLLLGTLFMIFQFMGWNTLVEGGVYFTGEGSNSAGSYLYILTATHFAHLIGGMIAVLFTFKGAIKEKYNKSNVLGLELCGIYWHFLDALWIYLFLFLIFIH